MDIAALAAELAAEHPETGAYDADGAVAAAQLNAENITADVASVTGQQIFEAVVPADYNALTSDNKLLFGTIIGMGSIPVNATNTKLALTTMFSGATATLSALSALQTEQVSRATQLKLPTIYEGHVHQARMI